MSATLAEFDSIIARGRAGTMTARDVAELAMRLAASGRRLVWDPGPPVVDLASTGGPGSLSTLLVPLELRRLGGRVVKLGVPGRPAGGVDALGTVPGYSIRLDEEAVARTVERCGYAHFLADERFAPMDAALFAYRREQGAVAVPPLAAASLLSKKIAVGLQVVGLDVRVGPHGNFGATLNEARENAHVFCEAAALVGIRAVAFLFECSGAEQPWVGRGEALAAVDAVLRCVAENDLAVHAARCFEMAGAVAREAGFPDSVADLSEGADQSRLAIFEANLVAQGASLAAFRKRTAEIAGATRHAVRAEADGVVTVDMAALRDALVDAQRQAEMAPGAPSKAFADPAGVVLRQRRGDPARAGDVLAHVRLGDSRFTPAGREELVRRVAAAVGANRSPGSAVKPAPMEVVRA